MNRWTGILLCAALCGALHAQDCGDDSNTLIGTVLDPSGAAVAGASLRLQAAVPEETTTGQHGGFAFHCAGSDPYQITVLANGFAESQVSGHGSANVTVHLRIAEVHRCRSRRQWSLG